MRIELWILLALVGIGYDIVYIGMLKYLYFTLIAFGITTTQLVVGIGVLIAIILLQQNRYSAPTAIFDAAQLYVTSHKYQQSSSPYQSQSATLVHPQNNQNQNKPVSNTFKSKKRSVSESKKKFVAAQQQWACDGCSSMLDHTFEIDHRIRLEYGGSNDTDNLVAMCRNCHGKKTSLENM
mgnify:CR=1 FL=1